MKCKICNCELTSGTAKCLKCGFPVLQMIKGDAAEEQKMNDLVKNFRKKKVEPVRIYLTVYKNAIEKDKVKVVETEKILRKLFFLSLFSKFHSLAENECF